MVSFPLNHKSNSNEPIINCSGANDSQLFGLCRCVAKFFLGSFYRPSANISMAYKNKTLAAYPGADSMPVPGVVQLWGGSHRWNWPIPRLEARINRLGI